MSSSIRRDGDKQNGVYTASAILVALRQNLRPSVAGRTGRRKSMPVFLNRKAVLSLLNEEVGKRE